MLIVSALPYFLGLVVTLPVLGHAPGNLYRRIVAPAAARAERRLAHGIINSSWPGMPFEERRRFRSPMNRP